MSIGEYREYIQELIDTIVHDEPGLSYVRLEELLLEELQRVRAEEARLYGEKQ